MQRRQAPRRRHNIEKSFVIFLRFAVFRKIKLSSNPLRYQLRNDVTSANQRHGQQALFFFLFGSWPHVKGHVFIGGSYRLPVQFYLEKKYCYCRKQSHLTGKSKEICSDYNLTSWELVNYEKNCRCSRNKLKPFTKNIHP